MNAKETFERLGYDLIGNCGGLTYAKKDGLGHQETIRFQDNYKLVYFYWESTNPADDRVLPYKVMLNVNIYNAVNKQMKELGWI